MLRTSSLLISLLALALMIPSCHATTVEAIETGNHGPLASGLPDLADLPIRKTSAGQLQLDGSDYEGGLAHQHVTALTYRGYYSPEGWDLSSAAFALYGFDLGGHSGAESLLFQWVRAWDFSTAPANFYVALANWQSGSWDVMAMAEVSALPIGDVGPYVRPADGLFFAAPIFFGQHVTGPDLKSIAIAEAPLVSGVQPLTVIEGLPVSPVATVSGTTPIEYSWSLGDAATPSTSTEESPQITPGDPGVYDCSLTVTNAVGQDTYDFKLTVNEQSSNWDHTYGNVLGQAAVGCDTDSDGNLCLADSGNTIVKISPVGELMLSTHFTITDPDATSYESSGLAMDGSDNIYICGSFGPVRDYNGVYVLKFDPQTLQNQWVTIWDFDSPGPGDRETATAIATDQLGNIYVCGFTESWGEGYFNIFLIKLDADGNLVWQRCWGTAFADYPGAIAVDGETLYLACYYHDLETPPPGDVWQAYILEYSTAGVVGGATAFDCKTLSDIALDASGNIFVAGYQSGTEALFKFTPELSLDWARTVGYDDYFGSHGIMVRGSTVYYLAVCFGDEILAKRHGVFAVFDSGGTLSQGEAWGLQEDEDSYMLCATPGPGSSVYLCGSAIDVSGGWTDITGEMRNAPASAEVYVLAGQQFEATQSLVPGSGHHDTLPFAVDTGGGNADFLVSRR